jgi:hypothetical protein
MATAQSLVSAEGCDGGGGGPTLGSERTRRVLVTRRAWLAAAGGSGSTASAEAVRCPGFGSVRVRRTDLYPRHTAARVDSLSMKHGRSLRHLGVRRWQPRGQPRECQLRSLRRTQSAWSRRHGPHREVRVSARIERWGGRQRQEGNGRSDAVRLLASGMLRRVRTALRETTVTTRRDTRCSNRLERGPSGPRSRRPESEVGKRSEPYPYRDARCPEPRAEQTVEVVGIHEGGT